MGNNLSLFILKNKKIEKGKKQGNYFISFPYVFTCNWNTVSLPHNIHIKDQKADWKEKIGDISKMLLILMIFSMKMSKNENIEFFWEGSDNCLYECISMSFF